MKYKHIKLVSLLIDYLTVHGGCCMSVEEYLLQQGIRYPERELRELTLEIQERMATYE